MQHMYIDAVRWFDTISHLGVLKCSSDTLDMVWAALSSVQLVNKVPVTVRVLSVCSTLRTLKPTVNKLFEAATAHISGSPEPTQQAAAASNSDDGTQQSAEQKFLQVAREELQESLTSG